MWLTRVASPTLAIPPTRDSPLCSMGPVRSVMRTSMRAARLVPAVLLMLASICLPRPVMAQSVYGQVWGRLTAVAGTPVSGASVAVTAAQTEARARTKTDAKGYFTISNLAPDLYQIEVQADGFKHVQDSISVSADTTTTV